MSRATRPGFYVPPNRRDLEWASSASRPAVRTLIVLLALGGGSVVGAAVAVKPKFGVAAVVAVALALMVLRRLETGALALVALVPVLSGIKRGWPIPGFRLTEVLTAGVAVLVFALVRHGQVPPWTRVEYLMAAYTVGGVVLGLVDARSLHQHLGFQAYGTLIGPLQFFLLFRCIRIALHRADHRRRAVAILFIASAVVSVVALAQQANLPKVRGYLLNLTGSDVLAGNGSGYDVFARATGPFPHWTPLAGYLAVLLVLGLAVSLQGEDLPLRRRTLNGILVLDAIALAFTAELSAMFGLAVAFLVIGGLFHQFNRVVRLAVAAVAVIALVAGPYVATRVNNEYSKMAGTNRSQVLPQTIEFRVSIWEHQYFPAIAERPVTGYGTVTPSMVVWPATESQYVTVLERGGAILMALYIALMAGLATAGVAVARSTDDALCRACGYSVATLVLILIPMDIVFPYFEDSGMPQALWALVGITMAVSRGPLPHVGLTRVRSRPYGFPMPGFTALPELTPRSSEVPSG